MKRFVLIALVFLLYFQSVSAEVMRQLNATMEVHEDGKVDMGVSFKFTEELKEVNFPLSEGIYGLSVRNGECRIKKEVKNVLSCRPPSPFMVGEIVIYTEFKTVGMVGRIENISYFKFDVPIMWDTDDVFIVVKLPSGMALIDNKLLPLSPSGADIGSDGRRIVLKWHFQDKRPGDVIPLRVYYESLAPWQSMLERFGYGWIVLSLIIIIVGLGSIYKKVSKRSELVLSVLNEAERMLVDIINKTEKKMIDQRRLVSLSGFSKAKVSRIVRSLEERGVIEVKRVGRRNRITLKKRFITE